MHSGQKLIASQAIEKRMMGIALWVWHHLAGVKSEGYVLRPYARPDWTRALYREKSRVLCSLSTEAAGAWW
jgi:hypothetical protein